MDEAKEVVTPEVTEEVTASEAVETVEAETSTSEETVAQCIAMPMIRLREQTVHITFFSEELRGMIKDFIK